jgi:hypothetical protein
MKMEMNEGIRHRFKKVNRERPSSKWGCRISEARSQKPEYRIWNTEYGMAGGNP